MRRDDYDESRSAPAAVVTAVAAGTVPTPFLAIYAVLFLVHGTVHPVVPPDITDTKTGELLAGILAAAVFAICVTSLLWAINGRRRWPFATVQAALLGTAVWFLVDGTKGGTTASVVVAATSVTGLALILLPSSAAYYSAGTPVLTRLRAARARPAPARRPSPS